MTDVRHAHVRERENQWRGVHGLAVHEGRLQRPFECVATKKLLDWLTGLRLAGSSAEAARLFDEREAERDADADAEAQLADF